MIKLYHGSNMAIERIDLSIGRKGKDFGQGFYLSPNIAQAQRMAQIAVEREGFGTPTVTTYLFDEVINSLILTQPNGRSSLLPIAKIVRTLLSISLILSMVRLLTTVWVYRCNDICNIILMQSDLWKN